jgi:hypothetical protein
MILHNQKSLKGRNSINPEITRLNRYLIKQWQRNNFMSLKFAKHSLEAFVQGGCDETGLRRDKLPAVNRCKERHCKNYLTLSDYMNRKEKCPNFSLNFFMKAVDDLLSDQTSNNRTD